MGPFREHRNRHLPSSCTDLVAIAPGRVAKRSAGREDGEVTEPPRGVGPETGDNARVQRGGTAGRWWARWTCSSRRTSRTLTRCSTSTRRSKFEFFNATALDLELEPLSAVSVSAPRWVLQGKAASQRDPQTAIATSIVICDLEREAALGIGRGWPHRLLSQVEPRRAAAREPGAQGTSRRVHGLCCMYLYILYARRTGGTCVCVSLSPPLSLWVYRRVKRT